jgi:hypothetical protein
MQRIAANSSAHLASGRPWLAGRIFCPQRGPSGLPDRLQRAAVGQQRVALRAFRHRVDRRARLLRALGVAGLDIPERTDERAATEGASVVP